MTTIPGLSIEESRFARPAEPEGSLVRWELNGDLVLHGYRAGGFGWLELPGVAVFRFGETGNVMVVADGAPPEDIEDAWVRSVLPLVVQARGTQVLHASAVTAIRGITALCGTSTAGKSTLAAALLARGREVVADDALAFEVGDDAVDAFPLPFRLRLREEAQKALQLPPIAARGDGARGRLAAVVILTPADVEVAKLSTLAASDAFGTLMPHAYCFSLEEGKQALVEAYLALARTVPVWRLDYPQRLDRLDETVAVLDAVLDR